MMVNFMFYLTIEKLSMNTVHVLRNDIKYKTLMCALTYGIDMERYWNKPVGNYPQTFPRSWKGMYENWTVVPNC